MKKRVVIGLLGTVLDHGRNKRWERWRPSIALCRQEALPVDRFVILYQKRFESLLQLIASDLGQVSPATEIVPQLIEFDDPWDFENVYAALHDFARAYPFDPEHEEYLIHITTGTHVAQICLFLLTESHYFPAKLIQTSPSRHGEDKTIGEHAIIDLDLSRYDRLATRFNLEKRDDLSLLKSGIETRNPRFNRLIEQIERVAANSVDPLLLSGPTGAGKSQLARRIYELKKAKRLFSGAFVEINCATLRGDGAMSTLFGHKRGAFTGAIADRPGLLRSADQGLLFLDEVGELGVDEQAMLLQALERKLFFPVGADNEVGSDFQLLCGTNRDLREEVAKGRFREDLLARINLWSFALPGLRERPEDLAPNLDYELNRYAARTNTSVTFNREARARFLSFAVSGEAVWSANFRDLGGAVTRMATLAPGGRITLAVVEEELQRLRLAWKSAESAVLSRPDLISESTWSGLDLFDQIQLAEVLRICCNARNLSEAGRILFSVSRQEKRTTNDADRLRKYLARFNLGWEEIQGGDDGGVSI